MVIEKNKGNVSNVLVANCFQIWPSHDGKYYNDIKKVLIKFKEILWF